MYKLSSYISKYEKNGFIALWNALNMQKIYGKEKLNNVYEELKNKSEFSKSYLSRYEPEIINSLIDNDFIIDVNKEESLTFHSLIKEAGKMELKNLVLLISNECNFNCAYCQIEKNINEKKHYNMSIETAEKAIEIFKNNSHDDIHKTVTITGGEPLLNSQALKFIIDKVNTELTNTRIIIFTNGSLIDSKIANYLKKNNVLVLISLDGPEELHNLARKDKQGKGTFFKVMQGYKVLFDSGVNLGISAVGGQHNINRLNDLIDFFINLQPNSIGLNFSHHLLNQSNPMEISIYEFGKKLIEFYHAMRKKNIYVENISRVIKSFSANKPRLHECQGEGSGITVDARGKVGPCKSLLVSDIFAMSLEEVNEVKNTKIFVDWSKRTPLRFKNCQHCPAVMLCGGGCAYDSYVGNNGDYMQVDKRICDYHKYVLEFLLWDLFDSLESEATFQEIFVPSQEYQLDAFNRYNNENNELHKSVGHEN